MTDDQPVTLETRFLRCGPASASEWFAVPMPRSQALEFQSRAHSVLQRAYLTDGERLAGRLMELVSGFWLERPIETQFRVLRPNLEGWRRALLDLVYGQLLVSRRELPAMQHLDEGFIAAADFLAPNAYFTVMNRHELLRHLPLFAEPRPVRTLDELLAEARVIRRLRGKGGSPGDTGEKHKDTNGR